MSKTTNKHKSLSKAALQCEVDRGAEEEREKGREGSAPGCDYSEAATWLCFPPTLPLRVQIEDNVVTSTKTAQSENNNKCMEKQITIRFTSSSSCSRIFKIIPFVKIDCSLSIKKSTLQASPDCVAERWNTNRGSNIAMWHVDRPETSRGHKSLVCPTDLCVAVTSLYTTCTRLPDRLMT